MKYIIDHEDYGDRAEFESLADAQAALNALAMDWDCPPPQLTEDGSVIRDETRRVVGSVAEDTPLLHMVDDSILTQTDLVIGRLVESERTIRGQIRVTPINADVLAALKAMLDVHDRRKHPLGDPDEGISYDAAQAAMKARAVISRAKGGE